jgi:hypothetical protein
MPLPPPLSLDHLDRDGVRPRMLKLWRSELATLEASGSPWDAWPYGAYLTASGWERYLDSMPVALAEKDMAWLAAEMSDQTFWLTHHVYYRRGRAVRRSVPQPSALVALTYGEFNTAYVRAVATVAQNEGIETCIIYRAAPASVPRDSCTYMEDVSISISAILDGHRAYLQDVGQSEISVPAGPNCHHSIRITAWSAETVPAAESSE